MALTVLAAMVVIVRARGPAPGPVISPLLTGIVISSLIGGLLGWFMPRREFAASAPTTLSAFPSPLSNAPTLAGLSHWVLLKVRATLRPRSLAHLLLPAMLLLPLDVTGNVAIAVLVVWGLALYLVALLRAVIYVAQHGADWLRPTPLSFPRFAWAVARLPLLKQVQWTLVAAGLLIAVGCKPLVAVRLAEWWLALVTLTSSLALAQAYQAKSLSLRLTAAVVVLALAERLRQNTALPCALLISAWQFRRVSRS